MFTMMIVCFSGAFVTSILTALQEVFGDLVNSLTPRAAGGLGCEGAVHAFNKLPRTRDICTTCSQRHALTQTSRPFLSLFTPLLPLHVPSNVTSDK